MFSDVIRYLKHRHANGHNVVRGLLILLAAYLVVVYYFLFEPDFYTESLVAGLAGYVVFLAPPLLIIQLVLYARRHKQVERKETEKDE